MRILIATHYWPPHRGGIETVASQQAHWLARRGHQVSVITSSVGNEAASAEDDGISIVRIRAADFLHARGIPYPIFSPGVLPAMTNLVRLHDVTLIHSHVFLSSVTAALSAHRCGRPTVVLQHNPFVKYRWPWSSVERAADAMLGRRVLRSATKILAVSEYTASYVRGLVPDRDVEVLYNGVDTERFRPVLSSEERKAARARLGLADDSFVVFTLRRLVFRNGLDTLLAACPQLKRMKRIVVLVGGSGPERPALERMIQEHDLANVRLLGPIPDDALPEVYRAADVFALPTRTGEGLGLVVLEAFASGIPVIATRGGGQEELVGVGRTGLLSPPSSADALADAAALLEARPELTQQMGQEARRWVLGMDWQSNAIRLERALCEATAEGAEPDVAKSMQESWRAAS